jgi:polysaccharide biosynthesis protein PslF
MKTANFSGNVIFVSTYPPRECGIATFTQDLLNALIQNRQVNSAEVIAIDDGNNFYDEFVIDTISQHDKQSYIDVALKVNQMDVDAVIIEHEFGIFGGEEGAFILDFMDHLDIPVITTFHTILSNPSNQQKRVLKSIAQKSKGVVTMAMNTISILTNVYDIPSPKISVIPHGVPIINTSGRDTLKKTHNLEGKKVISTFGLLSEGKGVEYGIKAMEHVVKDNPNAMYLVLGATHPCIKAQSGESYRESLMKISKNLGIEKNIVFVNKYFSKKEIIEYLQISDIYLTPYLGKEQACSGTLAYAVGYGKAMVSTPYLYAKEILAEGRGILVDFKSPESISKAINRILKNPALQMDMETRALKFGSKMTWKNVAISFSDCIEKVSNVKVNNIV